MILEAMALSAINLVPLYYRAFAFWWRTFHTGANTPELLTQHDWFIVGHTKPRRALSAVLKQGQQENMALRHRERRIPKPLAHGEHARMRSR